jgi:hypothetical protein
LEASFAAKSTDFRGKFILILLYVFFYETLVVTIILITPAILKSTIVCAALFGPIYNAKHFTLGSLTFYDFEEVS